MVSLCAAYIDIAFAQVLPGASLELKCIAIAGMIVRFGQRSFLLKSRRTSIET